MSLQSKLGLEKIKQQFPEKFASENVIFGKIKRGARIFVSTACGEPQYLLNALIKYVESNPKAICDAEVYQVWTMGVAPYTDVRFKDQFRQNTFFVGMNARQSVNEGFSDFTPVFLSQVPNLFDRGLVPIDVALIQTSLPDEHGYMSLGVSVDITRAAVRNADVIIAQTNAHMPRVHGNTFINVRDVDFLVHHDEPLLEFQNLMSNEIAERIGKHVARIINDGDTIQVGYGSVPNAIMGALRGKKHLGVHTELLTSGIVQLMKDGVIDNSQKTLIRNKTVASFCMGTQETYEYLHDNPGIEFCPIDYLNNPLVIAQNENMTAINSALQIDLTGQATAESLGSTFMSGIGGSADFMRGAVLAKGGKTILAIQSTAKNGAISRIVPNIDQGAGVTLNRGDVHYVVTEYGIAYLHGKNIRERAMSLIAIAHPDHRQWLIEEAKKHNFIFKDQAFIPGQRGEYPEDIETVRQTKRELCIMLRPVRINDEPMLKEFFYDLSDQSLYRRFMSSRQDMPHERLQGFVVIDYSREMVILATVNDGEKEIIVGLGQFSIYEESHTAEVAFVVRDSWQGKGIGSELLNYLTHLAVKQGLQGFTAEVLTENKAMLHLFEKMNFDMKKSIEAGTYELDMKFRGKL